MKDKIIKEIMEMEMINEVIEQVKKGTPIDLPALVMKGIVITVVEKTLSEVAKEIGYGKDADK